MINVTVNSLSQELTRMPVVVGPTIVFGDDSIIHISCEHFST